MFGGGGLAPRVPKKQKSGLTPSKNAEVRERAQTCRYKKRKGVLGKGDKYVGLTRFRRKNGK